MLAAAAELRACKIMYRQLDGLVIDIDDGSMLLK